ncbi:MAG: histidine phosphatase family protein [Planctomycetes bacterium]|nr:histidine phosphatase family protein [Actinomycetota bacterium]MBM4076735.1 histidine phosphatase family protein [Planctomycetota bacterium]
MELIIVRHALPLRVEKESGAADPELSPEGHLQAKALSQYLVHESIDAVYSSPLMRARQTAAPLATQLGLSVREADGVAEWDRNSSEYIPMEEMRATNHPKWQAMMRGEWVSDEDQEEFCARVRGAFNSLIETHQSECVVVVCHGGVINYYISHVLNMPTTQFFYPHYTSIHRVKAVAGGRQSLVTLNETAHLHPLINSRTTL